MELTADDRAALQGAIRVLAEILQQAPPEVPGRVEEWPEDDTHLRGEFWEDRHGTTWAWRDREGWRVWEPTRRFWKDAWTGAHGFLPFTRTTDPSQPRRFDSLADIPEGLERAAGKYLGHPCQLARSPLSGTGWMRRVDHPYTRQQWIEYMNLDEDDLTDLEEVIGHE